MSTCDLLIRVSNILTLDVFALEMNDISANISISADKCSFISSFKLIMYYFLKLRPFRCDCST